MRFLASWYGPLLLALPTACALYFTPNWIQWFGVPTPDQSLYPSLAACLCFGLAFCFGAMVAACQSVFLTWKKQWPWHLALAIMLIALCLSQIGNSPVLLPATDSPQKFLFAWMLTTAAWSCCFALIGLALHYLSNYRASLRYLADASYWIYLLHLPLVIALQAWVTKTEWHWLLKLTWVLGATMIISLLTYHFLVRFTWIGAALNGKRRSRKKAHLAMPNKMETSV